jgi:fumarate hydratase class I
MSRVVTLHPPLDEATVRALHAGDEVRISGRIYTGRDAVHKFLHEGGTPPFDLHGAVIYHCGPVVLETPQGYVMKAAGPTTSIREEPFQGELIQRLGIRAVVGKRGMGKRTLEACQRSGAVYLHAIGGAAQVYAANVERVVDVALKEFGSPEAMWVLEVKDFAAVVTMDSHGRSLHAEVSQASLAALNAVLKSAPGAR